MSLNIWEKLDKLHENANVENDTDYTLETLESMDWHEVGTEYSDFSTITATTYENSDGKLAKKVFSDGFIEYYEIA